jgi:hypothetical protein
VELPSIRELIRERDRMAKAIANWPPLDPDEPVDAVARELEKQRLIDLDAEIAERTGQSLPDTWYHLREVHNSDRR